MTAQPHNQAASAIGQVGLTCWSLAQRSAGADAFGGRIARRMAAISPGSGWSSLVSRYAIAEAHAPRAELTLLQRLAAADMAADDAPVGWQQRPAPAARHAGHAAGAAGAIPAPTRSAGAGPAPAARRAIASAAHTSRSAAEIAPPADDASRQPPAMRPLVARSPQTTLPGTLSIRRAPLPLLLAPPLSGEAGSTAPDATAARPHSRGPAAGPVAVSGAASARTTLQANASGSGPIAEWAASETHSANHQPVALPSVARSEPARQLPQPPMLAAIMRRALAAPAAPVLSAGPSPLERMAGVPAMGAQLASPAPGDAPYRSVGSALSEGTVHPQPHKRVSGGQVQRSAEVGAVPERTPLPSSLRRLIDTQHGTRPAAPLLLRAGAGSAPVAAAEAPTAGDPAGMAGPGTQQQPDRSASQAQRRSAASAPHAPIAPGHVATSALALLQRQASKAESGPRPAGDGHSLPAVAPGAAPGPLQPGRMPASAPVAARLVARTASPQPAIRSAAVAPLGGPGASHARDGAHAPDSGAQDEHRLDWGALPLVARAVQRQPIGTAAGGALAPIGQAARAAAVFGARHVAPSESSSPLGDMPAEGFRSHSDQAGISLPQAATHTAGRGAPLQRSLAGGTQPPETRVARVLLDGPRQQAPDHDDLVGAPLWPGTHSLTGAEALSAEPDSHAVQRAPFGTQPGLLRAAPLPALDPAPVPVAEPAPAVQRHSAAQSGSEAPDRWRVPPASTGAQAQRAAMLDMLRPLPGAIQREAESAPATEPGAAAPEPGAEQHPRDGAGSAVSGLASADQVDIEALAHKVYDHLRRQMRIDRERLGR
jgi:hypothetical protein